jgi:hypothetical protein
MRTSTLRLVVDQEIDDAEVERHLDKLRYLGFSEQQVGIVRDWLEEEEINLRGFGEMVENLCQSYLSQLLSQPPEGTVRLRSLAN